MCVYFFFFNSSDPSVAILLFIYLEAELVHGVDLVEIVHDKVEQRRSDSNRAIVFSCFVYLHLVNFSFQDLRDRREGENRHKKDEMKQVKVVQLRKY